MSPPRGQQKGQGVLEKQIQHDILMALGARPDLFIWRQNVGAAQVDGDRWVAFGVPGCADILGVLRGGRFLAIEVKRPGGRQSPAQKVFQATVEKQGGLYVLAFSVAEAVAAVDAALGRTT